MDPLLLMSDTQIKAEIDKLSPEEKAKFDDFASLLKTGMVKLANMNLWIRL